MFCNIASLILLVVAIVQHLGEHIPDFPVCKRCVSVLLNLVTSYSAPLYQVPHVYKCQFNKFRMTSDMI